MSLSVNIKKKLPDFTLDVSFEAGDEFFAVLGESGCGKSLTLRCIAGIETPDEGRIVLNNRVLFDSNQKINLSPQERKIGYLFQDYALFPNMTVEENIGIGVAKKRRKEETARFVKLFFLEGLEKKYPHMLSGGQKQRTALARIMILHPDMILLDEPFSAMDSCLKWKLEQQILNLSKSYVHTILFVSHDRDEVYRLCRKMAVLHRGKVEVCGDKREIFQQPQTVSAAVLTGCENIAEYIWKDEILYCEVWNFKKREMNFKSEAGAFLGVRACDIKVEQEKEKADMRCKVERVIESAAVWIYLLRPFEAKRILRMEISKEQMPVYCEGEEIFISIAPEKILFLGGESTWEYQ